MATEGAAEQPGRRATPSGDPGDPAGLDPAEAARIDALGFDDALAELQATVAELEQGGGPLEGAIALYERGVALHERCARLLAAAELRVERLVERAGGALEAVEARDEEESAQGR